MTSTIPNLLKYMNYLQKGMSVHTDNLNRSDVPGQNPYELKPFVDALRIIPQENLKATHNRHFSFVPTGLTQDGSSASFGLQKLSTDINPYDELHKANELGTEFMKATRIYQKSIGLFKTILK